MRHATCYTPCALRKLTLAVALALPPLSAPQTLLAANSDAHQSTGSARNFDIPAKPLSDALNDFIAVSDWEIGFPAGLARNVRAHPVKGAYTSRQALEKMLAGTGLAYQVTGENRATLLRTAETVAPTASNQEETTLAPLKVTASSLDEAKDDEADIDSTSPYNAYYNRTKSSTATKTDTPIMETPVSIQVVSRQILQDQQAFRIQDAIKNVSGVQQRFSTGGYDLFVVRGFELGEVGYRNGIRLTNLNFDLANVSQVEVLKGPASGLYGRIEPGGLINAITKRPQAEPYYALEQRFGSYDYYRTQVDATGPVTEDESLLYRFDLSYQNSNSFRDFNFTDRIFLAPGLTWRPSNNTEFNLSFEYLNNDFLYDSGIPIVGDRVANVPISHNYSQPNLGRNDNFENSLIDFNWSHRFNDNWKFQNGMVWATSKYIFNEIYAGDPYTVKNNQIIRTAWFGDAKNDTHTVYANLNGKFDTWGIAHNMLIGADYYSLDRTGQQHVVRPLDFIDIFNPKYPAIDVDKQILSQGWNIKAVNNDSWYGIYFQDELTLWNKLHVMGGGRYDWATNTSGWDDPAVFQTTTIRNDRFSPRVGLLYQPSDWLSLYGHYVESLGPNNGRSATGEPFQPQIASQYEGGIKTNIFDGRLTATVAYYHLTKNNVLTPDPVNPTFSVAIGEARSQGVEVDITGRITDGLSLIGNYAYTDTKITKDFSGNQDHRLPYVPLHSGSLWLKYDFQQAVLKGLSMGGGVFLSDKRYGDAGNSFFDDGYARVDLYAAYRFKVGPTHLTAQLNANNITDAKYFLLRRPASNLPAEPLTLFGSLRLEY